jgi:hypothetical protein
LPHGLLGDLAVAGQWQGIDEQDVSRALERGDVRADMGDERLCRSFGWDPFARTPRAEAAVGALRATDVDVSIRPRKEWARLYEQKQLAAT